MSRAARLRTEAELIADYSPSHLSARVRTNAEMQRFYPDNKAIRHEGALLAAEVKLREEFRRNRRAIMDAQVAEILASFHAKRAA